jgi:thiol-disulfide isomerase/thioredoxin
MKNLLILLLFFPAITLQGQISNVSLYTIDNEYVRLDDLKGEKLTIIDFWATWCKPCLIAIPELNEMYDKYKDQGVNIVGVNIDSPRNQSKVRPFAKSRGIDYPVVLDPDQEAMNEMNVVVFPTLMIFNKEGEMLYSHEGFRPGDQEIIREEIDKHLEGK